MSEFDDSHTSGRGPRLPAAPKLPKKSAKAKEAAAVDTTGRRTWRGYVLWVVIALLGLAAAAEFRAQANYRRTLSTCNAALEKIEGRSPSETKHITFDDLKESLPSNPVYTKEVHSYVPSGVYTWTWQGVRRYKVHLIVNLKDGTVLDVASEPEA
jgi:hypothetical protein